MTAPFLTNELNNLISESKRRNNELRTAAEKSLEELKALPTTSEQQLAADLSRRSAFIEPFLIACGTRNVKFASGGVACIQRLIISNGLPKTRLRDALEAFNTCSDLNFDVQLKILQALPSLVQNYANDLTNEELSAALQVCSVLRSAKVATVSGIAAATLQQLVTSVFDKVTAEDAQADRIPVSTEVPGDDGAIALRPAAFDAYRVFRDLVLVAEGRKPKFVQFGQITKEACLELIWTCIDANADLITHHRELSNVVRSNVLPLALQALSEKHSFSITVRSMRILTLVLTRYLPQFMGEGEIALGLATSLLDPEAAPYWKRCLLMEVLRRILANKDLAIMAFIAYDSAEEGKPIMQDVMSAFVRLSTEKPSAIGLGQQSSTPIGPTQHDQAAEQLAIEASGGIAVFGSAIGAVESNVQGISTQWSLPKTACIDQLDKTDPPTLPETYLYSLVLQCFDVLTENLANPVLKMTVQYEKSRSRSTQNHEEDDGDTANQPQRTRPSRSQSFRKRSVPLNPLDLDNSPAQEKVRAVAGLIESCWPAFLATSSTFLNAALDDYYYRSLIKAYQRFAQVAGLLRLSTPRDALMTTLAKAAVPPQVLNAANMDIARSPTVESPRVFSNPRSLLSVESLVSQASSSTTERDGKPSFEHSRPVLTVRNLMCLRALLNLAIALGPTLGEAFSVIVDVLKQADMVLSAVGSQRQGSVSTQKGTDSPSVVQAFSAEVGAVEAAASRLLESTADYPNDAFLNVVEVFCRLLRGKSPAAERSPSIDHQSPPLTPRLKERSFSGLPGISTFVEMQARDYQFIIPKLGTLAALNVPRFVFNDPSESGWRRLINELSAIAIPASTPAAARRASADLLCRISAECISEVSDEEEELRGAMQRRALGVLLRLIEGIYAEDGELTSTDLEIHGHVLSALKSILDRDADSLVAGWNKTVAMISSVFDGDKSTTSPDDEEHTHIDWSGISKELVSLRLGRDAFAALQLICSDFISSLPVEVVPAVVELLYRFMSQTDDLNISLTAITMTWNLADTLFEASVGDSVGKSASIARSPLELDTQLRKDTEASRSAQWLLIIVRLRDVVETAQQEIRSTAFQILCSIFKNHGSQLSPSGWELILHTVMLPVVAAEANPPTNERRDRKQKDVTDSSDMTASILAGTSDLIAQHLPIIEQSAQLSEIWETLTSIMEAILDQSQMRKCTAVYEALAMILGAIILPLRSWKQPVQRVFSLWAQRLPPMTANRGSGETNQETFLAYTRLASELYRLIGDDISSEQIGLFVNNLCHCIKSSNASFYGADSSVLSPLQDKVLKLLKTTRQEGHQAPSHLLRASAELTTLHHETADRSSNNERPSFVALAAESMDWLREFALKHAADPEVYESGALLQGIQSLRGVLERKYAFRVDYKGLPVWRRATDVSIALSAPILDSLERLDISRDVQTALWTVFAEIASWVAKANGIQLLGDKQRIYGDEMSDVDALKQLQHVLIPRLGNSNLPDQVRNIYIASLFDASLVHATERGELPGPGESPLADIERIRRGRVKKIALSQRENMCYSCFDQLVALSSKSDDSTERKTLAQAAAPLLILRLAIPLRAYIADQPLRGCAPQPLSELEELQYCLKEIATLELEPGALTKDPVAAGRRGAKAHLHYLYPLLARAVRTAGDPRCGSEEMLKSLQEVLEKIIVMP